MKIKKVGSKKALEIINKKEPRGLFYQKLGSDYIGIDNSRGYPCTRRFKKYKALKAWLTHADRISGIYANELPGQISIFDFDCGEVSI